MAYPINKPFALGAIDQRPTAQRDVANRHSRWIRRAGGREERVLAPVPPINRVLRVMLQTRWTQFGDVVAECGVPGGEVVARDPGLARG